MVQYQAPKRTIRAACERCRGQKLRCVKDQGASICDRCASIGAECVFNDALPAGRPPTNFSNDFLPESRNRKDRQDNEKKRRYRMSSGIVAPDELEEQESSNFNALGGGSAAAQLPHPSAFDLYSFDRPTSGPDSSMGLEAPHANELDSNLFANYGLDFTDRTPPATAASPRSIHAAFNTQQHFDLSPFTRFSDPTRSSLAQDELAVLTPQSNSESPDNGIRVPSRGHKNYGFEQYISKALADLSVVVKSQLSEAHGHDMIRNSTKSIDAELVKGVIKSSSGFFNILKEYRHYISSNALVGYQFSYASGSSFSATGTSDVSDSSSLQGPDVLGAFELLILYNRILHLHKHLYANVLSFLRSSDHCSERKRSLQGLEPLLQDMNVAGVALVGFGDFQVKLLLQIAAHLLGEIENELGLPERYRVSSIQNSRSPHTNGILQASLPLGSLEATMDALRGGRQLGETEDEPMDGLEQTQAFIAELQQLLKGSIQV